MYVVFTLLTKELNFKLSIKVFSTASRSSTPLTCLIILRGDKKNHSTKEAGGGVGVSLAFRQQLESCIGIATKMQYRYFDWLLETGILTTKLTLLNIRPRYVSYRAVSHPSLSDLPRSLCSFLLLFLLPSYIHSSL